MNRYRDPAGGIRMPVRIRYVTFPRDVLSKELNCVDFTAYRAISSITLSNPALRAQFDRRASVRRISGGRGKL